MGCVCRKHGGEGPMCAYVDDVCTPLTIEAAQDREEVIFEVLDEVANAHRRKEYSDTKHGKL
eukprot:6902726-Prorocentrum_lima.AAC.1